MPKRLYSRIGTKKIALTVSCNLKDKNYSMQKRKIKINGHTEVETLKAFILKKLNLIDLGKNNLQEFESRLKAYLSRNRNLMLEFVLDNVRFENDISFRINLINKQTNSYPQNYEFGNPLNRWIDSGIPTNLDETQLNDLTIRHQVNERIESFNLFFIQLERLSDGQIKIVKE